MHRQRQTDTHTHTHTRMRHGARERSVCFLYPSRHVVYAPSIHNAYASSAFPGISDTVFEQDWNQVRLQVSLAALRVKAAADVMTDALETAIYN